MGRITVMATAAIFEGSVVRSLHMGSKHGQNQNLLAGMERAENLPLKTVYFAHFMTKSIVLHHLSNFVFTSGKAIYESSGQNF